jgi:PAS domain S-box-containing protein
MKKVKQHTGKLLERAFGKHEDFTLEHQCFIGICFFTAILFFISVILNIFIGLNLETVIGTLFFGIAFSGFYFLARWKGIFYPIYWIVLACGCLFVSISWFYTGGISGAATTISLVMLAMVNLVAIKGRRLLSIFILSFNLFILYCIEFIKPDLIILYENNMAKFVDNYFTYIIGGLIISFVIHFIMQHFRSERKKVKDSEEKLIAILNNIPDLAWLKDSDSKFTKVNQPFSSACGLAIPDIIGKTVYDVWPEKLAEQLAKDDFEILKTGKRLYKNEIIFDRQNREIRLETIKTPIMNQDGKITGIVGIARDITEKKQMEQRLVQSEKMEAIGTLAGGIAHDFNNILSGILGYAQLGKTNIDNPGKLSRHLEQIIKGSQRAAELVRQILTVSRQYEYEKKPLQICVVVKEVLKLIRATIPAFVEIREDINCESIILADPSQIHQIIMNLCTNAYQSMPDTKGTLSVVLKNIKITEKDSFSGFDIKPGDFLKLEISDTGKGMDKHTLEKVFDPYFTTKEIGKGTGLGLALVHGIVQEHKGFIQVDSEPGKGSCFRIFFPVVEKKTESVTPMVSKTLKLSTGTESIMVVDDEKSIRCSTRELLEDCGYKVSVFLNGREAFDDFQRNPDKYDLIITDMTMPEMTGDILARKILEIKPGLPIILCTGYSDRITQDQVYKIGIMRYIQKPLINDDIAVIIRDVLDEKKT